MRHKSCACATRRVSPPPYRVLDWLADGSDRDAAGSQGFRSSVDHLLELIILPRNKIEGFPESIWAMPCFTPPRGKARNVRESTTTGPGATALHDAAPEDLWHTPTIGHGPGTA